jgi:hypothetical protein
VLIVSAAPKLDVADRGDPTPRKRDDMMKLQEACLTAAALSPFERTAAAVARPDSAADGRRNMTAACGDRAGHLSRRFRLRQLRSLELLEQQRQRAIDNRRGIAVGNRVPQQILRTPELVVGLAADGELQLCTAQR